MVTSCDDHELNQRIIDAFRAHYDDMVEAMTVCAGKIARILYQSKIIDVEKMREANDTRSKYHGSIAVVDAINVYIKTWESSSKSLEVLAILEKHPPLDAVTAKIRKHVYPSASGEWMLNRAEITNQCPKICSGIDFFVKTCSDVYYWFSASL